MKENEAKMVSKVQKLSVLRSIINGDSDSGGSVSDTPRALPTFASNTKSKAVPAQSILNVARLTHAFNFKVPRQVPGAVQACASGYGPRRGLRTKSPPPVLPVNSLIFIYHFIYNFFILCNETSGWKCFIALIL